MDSDVARRASVAVALLVSEFCKQCAHDGYSGGLGAAAEFISALLVYCCIMISGMRGIRSGTRRIAGICGFSLALVAQQAGAVFVVNQPWVRPAQRTHATEAYMNMTSTDAATLVGVASDAADATIQAPGKAAKRVNRLALPAQTVVALAPGEYRVVLSRLARTLKLGDRVQLRLIIEAADGSRQDVGVDAEVRLHSPLDDELHAHHHGH